MSCYLALFLKTVFLVGVIFGPMIRLHMPNVGLIPNFENHKILILIDLLEYVSFSTKLELGLRQFFGILNIHRASEPNIELLLNINKLCGYRSTEEYPLFEEYQNLHLRNSPLVADVTLFCILRSLV